MEKSSKVNLAIFSAGLMTFIGILNETSMNVTYPLLVKEFHQPWQPSSGSLPPTCSSRSRLAGCI